MYTDHRTIRRPFSSARSLALVVLLAMALIGALVPSADASTSTGGPDVVAAHLRVSLDTTSDWTQVRFSPGTIVTRQTLHATDGAEVVPIADGIKVEPTTGRARVVVDLVFLEATGERSFTIGVDKGYAGETVVRVENRNAKPDTAARIVDDIHSTSDPSNHTQVTVGRDKLLSTHRLDLPTTGVPKQVLAFYYPWFTDYSDLTLTDRPSDPRSTADAQGVLSMTRQARSHGIDGFVVSWAGDAADGNGFDLALQAAEATDGVVTGYLETRRARPDSGDEGAFAWTVYVWLHQLLTRADSPAFLRADGVPVVFAYEMGLLPPARWQKIEQLLANDGLPVRIVGDTNSDAFSSVQWGAHQYTATGAPRQREQYARATAVRMRAPALLDKHAEPRLFAATVSPGYDDHLIRDGNPIVERGVGGARYNKTWDAALTANPDWVLITSWNEWYEGTSVEPSVIYGDTALTQTAQRSADWKH